MLARFLPNFGFFLKSGVCLLFTLLIFWISILWLSIADEGSLPETGRYGAPKLNVTLYFATTRPVSLLVDCKSPRAS